MTTLIGILGFIAGVGVTLGLFIALVLRDYFRGRRG